MRSVDLRIGFVEVASFSSVTRRIEPELSRRPGNSSASVVHRGDDAKISPSRDEAPTWRLGRAKARRHSIGHGPE